MYVYIYTAAAKPAVAAAAPVKAVKEEEKKEQKEKVRIYIFIGSPVYQCGEHWSGGPSSLVRGAKEKLSILPIGCPQDSVSKILLARFC